MSGGGWEPSGTFTAFKTALAITTEMASQSQGIQQLLQAEKRAAEKVADARKSESPLSSLRSLERKLGVGDANILGKPKAGGKTARVWRLVRREEMDGY